MAEHLMNILYIISIIFFAYYGISYIYYKYIRKDIRFIGVDIFNYVLNTDKIMKGGK